MNRTVYGQTQSAIWRLLMMAVCLMAATAAMAQNNRGMLSQQRPGGMMPNAGSCTVNMLDLTFKTGNDDLRGSGNDLNVEVHFADGSMKLAKNVNKGANWANNSSHAVSIPLDRPVAPNQIRSIKLVHLAQGGYSANGAAMALSPSQEAAMLAGIKTEDNWDMAEMQAAAVSNGNRIPVANFGMHRFTGSNPSLDVMAMPNVTCAGGNEVTELEFVFQTGNDDLRGGNDNLNITIVGDGLNQREANVNQSQRWADGTGHRLSVSLNHPVSVQQIHQIILETTFGGGSGGDNWNMDSVQVYARVNGNNQPIATQGFFRFSGAPKNRLVIAAK